MPLIPLKQDVYVRKNISEKHNGWNQKDYADPVLYKVRATEKIEVVTNERGEEKTATVKLMFDKLPDITYKDLISFTNELGVTIEREPLSIKPIRMVNGKPALTTIHL